MPLPSWYSAGDPFTGRRMRTAIAIGSAEQQLRTAADTAISRFLDIARAGVLGEPTPEHALTAAEIGRAHV